jgi:orotidine-5'-phosphate decarboxylase
MSFVATLRDRWKSADSLVCVGLDPEPAKFPAHMRDDPDAVFAFCRVIVNATAEYAC